MADRSGVSDQYRKASAWPMFVALGLAIAETGVFLDIVALAVGGLLLFIGSLAGILHESGYIATPWRFIAALGTVLAVVGIGLSILYPISGGSGAISLGFRAISIAVAGVLCVAGSVIGHVFVRNRTALD